MKNFITICLLALACAGCVGIPVGTMDTAPRAGRLLTAITNEVPQITEAVIAEIEVVEAPPGVFTTNTVYKTVLQTNLVKEVRFVPRPEIVEGIATAREVSGWIPEPFGSIVTGVLGLGMVGLNAYARRKSRLANTLIAGVEQSENKDVKKAIQLLAIATGLEGELNKLVVKNTKPKRA